MWSPRPTETTQVVPSNGPPGRRPLRGDGKAVATTQASGAARSICASGCEGWVGIGTEIIPKVYSNAGQSLSHGGAVTAPFTQGSLGDGGCGLPRRFAPRNDSPKPLSFRGGPTGRRGNPSFLRWTGVWAAPRKTRGTARRVVVPYGKPDQPPKPAGAQRSVRASGREGWAGIDARTIPKGGPPPQPPRQRLAKRKARKEQLVKFGLCPMPSECSTAHHVRKSHQSPARAPADVTSTEQDRLAPRPAARQGASRP